jgi:hypothetical protein
MRWTLGLVLLVVACKPRVRAGDEAESRPAASEWESCATTADCGEGLRCLAQTCRRAASSRLGEYNWVAGQVALERGQKEQATVRFEEAMSQFEKEQVEPPAGLLCDYGEALRRRAGDAKSSEQAARLLHRCLLAAPWGTAEHARALRELVELEPLGLDPSLVARDTAGDRYLVKEVKRPPPVVKVEVTPKQVARDPGYQAWVARLGGDEVRKLLLGCWEKHGEGAEVTVVIGSKLRARLGDDDIYLGGTLELLPDPSREQGAAAPAIETCLRESLGELAAESAKKGHNDSWTGSVSIAFKPSEPQ